jgi:hypothetical protein
MAHQNLSEEKYLVFKSNELIELFGKYGLPMDDTDCAPVAEAILTDVENKRIKDAVVIRKQDVFAGPALHGYAASISVSARVLMSKVPDVATQLQDIADYFHREAVDADATSSKLPD